MKLEKQLPLKLQFFAEGGDDGSNGGANEDAGNSGGNENNSNNAGNDDGAMKLTQEQMNARLARHADEIQKNMLKEFGVESKDSIKEILTKHKEMEDANKTELEKAQSRLKELEEQSTKFQNAATEKEYQLAAFKAGVNADSIDEALTLAKTKVNDDTTIEDAVKGILEKYPIFGKSADSKDNDGFKVGSENKNKDNKDKSNGWKPRSGSGFTNFNKIV